MPFRKNLGKNVLKNATKNLKTIAYRSKIAQKMSSITTASLYYTVREVQDIDAGKGALELSENQTNLPLMIFPLRNIQQKTASGQGVYQLKLNTYDFTETISTLAAKSGQGAGAKITVQYAGQIGNNAYPVSDFTVMLLRYTSIKLLLYQHDKKDVTFTVRLVQLKDKVLDPCYTTTTTDLEEQQIRKKFYYYHLLRSQISNPLLENEENYTMEIKDKFKILWKKKYTFNEKLSTADAVNYRQVKIFTKYDKVIKYNENSKIGSVAIGAIDDNPDEPRWNATAGYAPLPTPATIDNLFLIVTANASKSYAEDNVNFDKITFDISIKNKFTIPVNAN